MKSNQTATVDVSTLGSNLDNHLILIPSQQLGTKSLKMRLEMHASPDACVSRCMRFQTHAFLDASLPIRVWWLSPLSGQKIDDELTRHCWQTMRIKQGCQITKVTYRRSAPQNPRPMMWTEYRWIHRLLPDPEGCTKHFFTDVFKKMGVKHSECPGPFVKGSIDCLHLQTSVMLWYEECCNALYRDKSHALRDPRVLNM